MATAVQFTANRANAQKSSGPRTEEGKSHSRLNAFFDRILPGLNSATELQLEITRRVASTMFLLAAVPTIEANMIAAVRFAENARFDPPVADLTNAMAVGTAFLQNSRAFHNLSLYEQRLSRGLQKDLELLGNLQNEAAQRTARPRPAAVKPIAQPVDSTAHEPEIGSVYATAPSDPAPPLPAASNDPQRRAA